MKTLKLILPLLLFLCMLSGVSGQNIDSLSLRDVDSNMVSLKSFASKKALVLVFTGNHCVYSKKYEDRLIRIATEFMAKDIGFCLVNSNDPELSQDDRWTMMRDRAKEKNYPCGYLQDLQGKLATAVGATKNPEVFVLRRNEKQWEVLYSGKIDDNPLIEEHVEHRYLVDELNRIVSGTLTPVSPEPAIGCNIKLK